MIDVKRRPGADGPDYYDEVAREYVITRPDTPTPRDVVPLCALGTATVRVEVVLT